MLVICGLGWWYIALLGKNIMRAEYLINSKILNSIKTVSRYRKKILLF